MNIMYCGDAYIQEGTLLSVMSLLDNVPEELHLYLMTASVGERAALDDCFADYLQALIRRQWPQGSVRLIDATEVFNSQLPEANMETRFTPCCMLRLYTDLFDDMPDRILYLDNDIVCCKNCQELYNTDMEQVEFAGVLDYYGRFFFRNSIWHMDYINSGVLVMNLAYMRETGLLAACRQRCVEEQMFMPDQTSLNKLATSKRILPRRYNDQRRDHDDTVMRHFSNCFGFFPPRLIDVKPWQVERVHEELKLHAYDGLLERYQEEWARYEQARQDWTGAQAAACAPSGSKDEVEAIA